MKPTLKPACPYCGETREVEPITVRGQIRYWFCRVCARSWTPEESKRCPST